MKIVKSKIGWKILEKGMKSQHNNFKWKKNKWYKHEGKINICNAGFHASKELVSAISYLTPGIICKVEYKGEIEEQEDKFVASEMRVIETYRFTKRIGVEWSVYCARSCLKNWNAYDKTDKRPLEAIDAAEAWLKNPTKKNRELAQSAARSAWSAGSAESARSAGLAARSAGSAAESVWSARSAWSPRSVWSAAESAGSAAAESVVEQKMKNKLHKKLLKIIGAKELGLEE